MNIDKKIPVEYYALIKREGKLPTIAMMKLEDGSKTGAIFKTQAECFKWIQKQDNPKNYILHKQELSDETRS
jgi:hypothetical protein